MKWLKTQNGNIIRLGAISEFIPYSCSMDILIGDTCVGRQETAYQYDDKEQAELVYKDLFSFITDEETNNEIFSFPKNDVNTWLKSYSFVDFAIEMDLSVRVQNACSQAGVKTVYDIMPTEDGWERCFSNLGKMGKEELRQKREEFIERHKVKKI
ncbi:MAG TPA: hypothetical protein PK155_07155 [Bacteroidales bacterium]|nr:hypothetical protein [Bacteroidales bacterium]